MVRRVGGQETGAMHIYTVMGTVGIQNEVSRQTWNLDWVGIHAEVNRNKFINEKVTKSLLLSTNNENDIPIAVWTDSSRRERDRKENHNKILHKEIQ